MKIKTSIKSIVPVIFLFFLGVVLFVKFMADSAVLALLFALLWLAVIARTLYTLCKIIEMDENGCTVKFLFFSQKYKWEDLKTRLAVYNGPNASKAPYRHYQYERTVIFSKKEKFKVPVFYDIETHYHLCLTPWSYFIVNLKDKEQKASCPTYEIDEELFMSKMVEWGVELVETPIRY